MQTHFSLAQLADPSIAEANKILRNCVHCGFCTATCPTFTLLGDELDSPRGRIYLIKEMLENDRPASAQVTKHIDRCLSCLSCMTTCPSGVHYMHLVDHARQHIEETYQRPWHDRALRWLLAQIIPHPNRFRLAILLASFGKALRPFLPARLAAMLKLAPKQFAARSALLSPQTIPAEGERKGRMAILAGCAQQVLAPAIHEATVRLLTRRGIEVVVTAGVGCCGSLVHHMGREKEAHSQARVAIEAWHREAETGGLDAIVFNASGCGTTIKDYDFMFRNDADLAEKAAKVSALAKDISEVLSDLPPSPIQNQCGKVLAYHAACSLQHGQKITEAPKALLQQAGYEVKVPQDSHLCCGSAGTYNLLQPELADQLLARKAATIKATGAEVIATGNIGCITQIAQAAELPIAHTVEWLDWAEGGPEPQALSRQD